ncbi:hypothetical protein F2Q69_00046428 [Brassica cretica]|uniref:Uncharacterized protein n=1 Tax=Brassica cretica TaxID=69181 RepID=A0A8S9PTE3_BRACR|nr:hypothetical protein F2Q69_00046428 [Brassica cretica]
MVSIHIKQSTFDYGFSLRFRITLTSSRVEWTSNEKKNRELNERELKLRSSDHKRKQAVVASGIESSIASWLRSCLGIELRRSEVASWDCVTNGNNMRIRFRVRDREFSTVKVYRRGDYGFVG